MSTKLVEYTKLHLISLEQDLESLDKEYTDSEDYNLIRGQIVATRHLLETMEEML